MLAPLIFNIIPYVQEDDGPLFVMFPGVIPVKFAAVRTDIENDQWVISPNRGLITATRSTINPPPMSVKNLSLFTLTLEGIWISLGVEESVPSVQSISIVIEGLPFGQPGGILTPPRD